MILKSPSSHNPYHHIIRIFPGWLSFSLSNKVTFLFFCFSIPMEIFIFSNHLWEILLICWQGCWTRGRYSYKVVDIFLISFSLSLSLSLYIYIYMKKNWPQVIQIEMVYFLRNKVDTIAFRFYWTIIRTIRSYISDVKCRWMYQKCKIYKNLEKLYNKKSWPFDQWIRNLSIN